MANEQNKGEILPGDFIYCFCFFIMHHDVMNHLFNNPKERRAQYVREFESVYRAFRDFVFSSISSKDDTIPVVIYTFMYFQQHLNNERVPEKALKPRERVFISYFLTQAWLFDAPLAKIVWKTRSKKFFTLKKKYSLEAVYCFLDLIDWNLRVSDDQYARAKQYLEGVHDLLKKRIELQVEEVGKKLE